MAQQGVPMAGQPIEFDTGDAADAVRFLESLEVSLRNAVSGFSNQLSTVTDGWHGRYRDVFDQEAEQNITDGLRLCEQLLSYATQIQTSIDVVSAYNATCGRTPLLDPTAPPVIPPSPTA